jgi:hypothetical protein
MQPLTLVTTRSPDKVTSAIAAGCTRLVPEESPIFVDRLPFAEARINKCTFNVRQFLADNPGEMLLGWEVCVWDGVLLDCIGHAVVKHEERLRCVTPSKYGDKRLLFLPDPRMSFDFDDPMARMPAKQVPLSMRPEVLRFIEVDAAERAIKIKYPVSSGQIMVQGVVAEALQRLAREKQRLSLKLVLMTSDNTTKCPCGSGKKFRKCHRMTIEQMLKFQ